MVTWEIATADVMDWAAGYEGLPFHAMLTDCPYELNFMSRKWDASGISFQPATWAALAQHLHPGAWGMAFASSRGWHRLAVAIEDSGMVIQPSVFNWQTGEVAEPKGLWGWLNAQSFPKATRLDKKIDKAAGKLEERETTGYRDTGGMGSGRVASEQAPSGIVSGAVNTFKVGHCDIPVTVPATPLARAWQGHRYGGQVLKNSLEPIICFQKPWTGKRLDCIVDTGAGALWVEGGRVEINPSIDDPRLGGRGSWNPTGKSIFFDGQGANVASSFQGRWPPNFALVHSPNCSRVYVEKWRITPPPKTCAHCGESSPIAGWDELDHIGEIVDYAGVEFKCEHCGERQEWEFECVRLEGEGRVRGSNKVSLSVSGPSTVQSADGGYGHTEASKILGYAGPDGTEPVARYACAIACANGHEWLAEDKEPCPECGAAGEWQCAVRRLGEQSGERGGGRVTLTIIERSPGGNKVTGVKEYVSKPLDDGRGWNQHGMVRGKQNAPEQYGDTGTAARFYPNPDWSYEVAERLAGADPVWYAPKAARAERESGLQGVLPCLQCGEADSAIHIVDTEMDEKIPARLAGSNGLPTLEEIRETVERIKKEKTGKARWVIRTCRRNDHPTVKNLSLCKWLATLLLPPPEYAPRRIVIPFAGSFSEAIGAMLAGWEEIVIIEMTPEYCEIGETRMQFWHAMMTQTGLTDPKAILKAVKSKDNGRRAKDHKQLELLEQES